MLLTVVVLFVGSRRRQGREIAFKSPHTYYKAVTGGSVDSWSLCGSVTLREAEGAKIAVVREVKDDQTFPPYDYTDSSGCPPPAASEMDNMPWLHLVLTSILDYWIMIA